MTRLHSDSDYQTSGNTTHRQMSRFQYLHVVYREVSLDDGFIVTAYIARKVNKRRAIWREDNH